EIVSEGAQAHLLSHDVRDRLAGEPDELTGHAKGDDEKRHDAHGGDAEEQEPLVPPLALGPRECPGGRPRRRCTRGVAPSVAAYDSKTLLARHSSPLIRSAECLNAG